jgi:WD40 repeat protein
MRILTGHRNPVGRVEFSPDSRHLLSADRPSSGFLNSERERLWDLAAGTSRVLNDSMDAVFTPDSRHVLTCLTPADDYQNRSLRLIDVATGAETPLAIRGRTPYDFVGPRFSPDGSLLVSQNASGYSPKRFGGFIVNWTSYPRWQPVGRWEMDGRLTPEQDVWGLDTVFVDVAFSPDGRTLAAVCQLGLVLFDVETGERTHFQKVDPKQGMGFLAYHPSGRQLVFGSGTKLSVFDTGTWSEAFSLKQTRKYFLSGAFTPDGRRFLTASNEETVKCWDTADWRLIREYAWNIGGLGCVAVAPDGMTAAAGSAKKKIVVWDLDD